MPRFIVIARDPLVAAEAASERLPEGQPVEQHHAADLTLEIIFNQLGILSS